MTPFHRDQKRIDSIGWKLQEHALLNDEDIHQLAHDWGDIEDASFELSRTFDKLVPTLQKLLTDPKECWTTFLAIRGWFDELRNHMDSAEKLIDVICNEIERRHPHINPTTDE